MSRNKWKLHFVKTDEHYDWWRTQDKDLSLCTTGVRLCFPKVVRNKEAVLKITKTPHENSQAFSVCINIYGNLCVSEQNNAKEQEVTGRTKRWLIAHFAISRYQYDRITLHASITNI